MKKISKKAIFFLLCIFNSQVFASDPKTLTVVLDWFVNPNYAPLFVAEQEGFFAKQGIQVKFIAPADVTEGEKMVAVGKADIAITYQPALIRHVSRGLPLIRFATLINTPLCCLVVLDNKGIYAIKDLKGKRIGYSASEADTIILATMLQSANLSTKDINMINVKFNLVSALLTGSIDGFTGGMRNFEPLAIKLAGKSTRTFYPEKFGFPRYDELVLIANKNKIHDPSLVKFTAALKEGVTFLKKNPEKCWQKFAVMHPELNNTLNKQVWFATLPYFASDPEKLDRDAYQKFTQFMVEKKLLKESLKIEDYTVELFN